MTPRPAASRRGPGQQQHGHPALSSLDAAPLLLLDQRPGVGLRLFLVPFLGQSLRGAAPLLLLLGHALHGGLLAQASRSHSE